jgi:excisionase family DNA binding protein
MGGKNMKKLLTPKQAAEYTGFSTEQLLEAAREGHLIAVRRNARVIKFEPEALEEYVEKLRA